MSQRILALLWLTSCFVFPTLSRCEAQESTLIDFARDVKPILTAKCLECHGPDDAKNDYRVDEEDNFLSYVEAGDLESSSLWADYLITDDEDLHMPPMDSPQLTGIELATIKLWIEEGAIWTESQVEEVGEGDSEGAAEEAVETAGPKSTVGKLWLFQGLFHPASVHFPIALLTVSAFCLFLSFFNRDSFEPVAFHCLWMGALGAVAACIMGWAYAQHEGYGSGFSLQNSAINRHRWLGIAVALAGLILIPIARNVRRKGQFKDRIIWLLSSVGLLLAVSTTGYQGGELTYGEDHYTKEYYKLFPEAAVSEEGGSDESVGESTSESADTAPSATEDVPATDSDTSDSDTSDSDTSDSDTSDSDTSDSDTSESVPQPESEQDSESAADAKETDSDS